MVLRGRGRDFGPRPAGCDRRVPRPRLARHRCCELGVQATDSAQKACGRRVTLPRSHAECCIGTGLVPVRLRREGLRPAGACSRPRCSALRRRRSSRGGSRFPTASCCPSHARGRWGSGCGAPWVWWRLCSPGLLILSCCESSRGGRSRPLVLTRWTAAAVKAGRRPPGGLWP